MCQSIWQLKAIRAFRNARKKRNSHFATLDTHASRLMLVVEKNESKRMEKKFSACISIKRLYEIFYTDSSEKESKLELSMAPHNANDTRKALSEEAKKIAKERKT